jgi:hypothetical protein
MFDCKKNNNNVVLIKKFSSVPANRLPAPLPPNVETGLVVSVQVLGGTGLRVSDIVTINDFSQNSIKLLFYTFFASV